MNREFEINEFLHFLAKMYLQNPKFPINITTIYSYLMNYGLEEYEIEDISVKYEFNKWIEHFSNNSNINVYHSDSQIRFLQFRSDETLNTKCVKLYVSFPRNKIYSCVNKIFEYISSNNMPTLSKVADMIRSDSVVIRLNEAEDAKKVISFINTDLELKNACKKTNPFLIREGNVGIAYDDRLSYNSTLSLLLEKYFKYCRGNNRLNEVSLNTFREYVSNFYKNVFSSKQNLNIFLKDPEVAQHIRRFFNNKGILITNYKQIIELIYESLNPKITVEKYFEIYEKYLDNESNKQLINYYNQLMSEQEISFTQEDINLLNSYIKYAEQKYGYEYVADYLKLYLESIPNAITRDYDYRNKFLIHLPGDKIIKITNGNLDKYVENQLQTKEKVYQKNM